MTEGRTVNCAAHGRQGIALVCQHIAHAVDATDPKVGFLIGDDTDLARPDAWCADCDARLRVNPDDPHWFDEAGFKIFCAACWDVARQRCAAPAQ